MNKEDKIKALIDEYNYNPLTAETYVNSDCYCVYCGEDCLDSRPSYSQSEMEHILPKSIYPQFKSDIRNWAYCCRSCNGMKDDFDPLQPGEDPEYQLENNREELIQRVKDYLGHRIAARSDEYNGIKNIIRGR